MVALTTGEKEYNDGIDPLVGKKRRVGWRWAFVARPAQRRAYDSFSMALILEEYEKQEPEDPVQQLTRILERSGARSRGQAELVASALNGRQK